MKEQKCCEKCEKVPRTESVLGVVYSVCRNSECGCHHPSVEPKCCETCRIFNDSDKDRKHPECMNILCTCHQKYCECKNSHGQQTLNGVPNGYCIDCNLPIRPSVEKFCKCKKPRCPWGSHSPSCTNWCDECGFPIHPSVEKKYSYCDQPSCPGHDSTPRVEPMRKIITSVKIGEDRFIPASSSVESREWEEEFCKRFVNSFARIEYTAQEVIDYITTLLHSEREKGRVEICGTRHQEVADKARTEERKAVLEMIEGMMKKDRVLFGDVATGVNREVDKVYNSAFSDLRDKLTNK